MNKARQAAEREVERRIAALVQVFAAAHLGSLVQHHLSRQPGELEFKASASADPLSRCLILRVAFAHPHQQVHIPNVYMPESLRGRGLGKLLIHQIYVAAGECGYETFVVQLTDGFMRRLVKRGAFVSDEDSVQITPTTDLLTPVVSS